MIRRSPVAYLASNLISLLGVVLVTSGAILWLMLLPSWWRGDTNPYAGILGTIVLPLVCFLGLLLIPLGVWFHDRKRRLAGEAGALLPKGGDLRRLLIFVGLTSFVNLAIGSQFLYSAVSYMDSDSFCGKACHVMEPEFTAYLSSPHARVGCVECHIGAGAPSLIRAKISGTRQLYGVVFHSYSKPIPAPVESLRPARDTCEHCHWPQRFGDRKFFVHTEYATDEQNVPSTTVALMKVGGETWNGTVGIHGAHGNAGGRVDYIATDKRRQSIAQVTYTAPDGKVTVYNSTDAPAKPEELAKAERRLMDCVDCHNRPTHIFQLPERALDTAMTDGRISPKLPFIKKQALEALKVDYPDRATARQQIAATLERFYQSKYPQAYTQDQALLKNAISQVQTIYAQNVFPEMKITWGTYPNNLGHTDSAGCFRCHDGNHSSSDGRSISNDCATCHDLLAVGEKDPKILTDLGLKAPPSTGGGGK
ncbi:MAG TPA: NapC/NirT family cytochrome c [Bryobacteraceae bacterium]|nr:NapC/NirT family cytochrome c [Bryobacteraceae bacterium]